MNKAVLVVNAGSSSIKFAVYEVDGMLPLLRGKIDDIGDKVHLDIRKDGQGLLMGCGQPPSDGDHAALLSWLMELLRTRLCDTELVAAGHRIVHGGPLFDAPAALSSDVLKKLEEFVPMAPNHQPHNLNAVKVVSSVWPGVMQVGCFDTAFHRTQPRLAQLFGLPRKLSDEGIVRYGFHGLSYQYIAETLESVSPEVAKGRVIVAHLGNGASMCAINNGHSVATTMGFTAMDGLVMGRRSGNLDPGIVLYLMEQKGMSAREVNHMLRRQSGLLGVSGINSDMRDLFADGSKHALEAIELFVYRVVCETGSLVAALGGLDAFVFTAGIGFNSAEIRERVCERLGFAGVALDKGANERGDTEVSAPGSRVQVLVIPTNEELMIARSAARLSGQAGYTKGDNY